MHNFHKRPPREYSTATIMSWASRRQTTRFKDRAYSLLGLIDIQMPHLYGEGSKAFQRLQSEIAKARNDPTIFLYDWEEWGDIFVGMSIRSPVTFGDEEKRHAYLWLEMPALQGEQIYTFLDNGCTIHQMAQTSSPKGYTTRKMIRSGIDWSLWAVCCIPLVEVVWSEKRGHPANEKHGQMKAVRRRRLFVAKRLKHPTRKWGFRRNRSILKEKFEVILVGSVLAT